MKRVRAAFWVIVIGLLVVIFFQNQKFFLESQSFRVDLYFRSFHTPQVPNSLLFLGFFLIGFLLSYFMYLPDRFRTRKAIRHLSTNLEASYRKISALESELTALKTISPAPTVPEEPAEPSAERLEPDRNAPV
jgi:uncharacterized integral membrane protein